MPATNKVTGIDDAERQPVKVNHWQIISGTAPRIWRVGSPAYSAKCVEPMCAI